MQRNISLIIGMIAFFMTSSLLAQRDKSYILQNTDTAALRKMAVEFANTYRTEHARAIAMATAMGWDTVNLERLDSRGNPIYIGTHNNDAATMTHTTTLRNNTGVQGQDMIIGEWDEGYARTTHQDLTGRVTIKDSGGSIASHSTHVGGTLIGRPPADEGDDSKGMAPYANLHTYTWTSDLTEMTTAAAQGLLVSNHSYGDHAGWKPEDTDENGCLFGGTDWTWYGPSDQYISGGDDIKFGQYNSESEDVDSICWNAPYYLPVLAAGNDHNDNPDEGIVCADVVRNGTGGTYEDYDMDIHPPGDGQQVSSIATWANAKNLLTVGNLEDDEDINESSSRGKTDDGRIKPDICGNGTELWSADSASDDDYSYKTGTSMASPNVAGSLLLLQQYYEELHGNNGTYMKSATLKGLAIHTAQDLGWFGPDYTFGWGLLDASAAGAVILDDATNSSGQNESRILEKEFSTTQASDSYYFNGGNSIPCKITICYTDRPGTGSDNHNETSPELKHDLDIRLYSVNTGNLVALPFAHGTDDWIPDLGDNDVDNIEQLFLSNPGNGLYELRVTVEGSLTTNQKYSLLVSGQDNTCQTNITHGTGAISSFIYRASNNIISQGNVWNNQYVTYQAANSVKLTPGFKAVPGSRFVANTKGCN
ncbi:MAG TPA: S8 family serine peptidase [Saprospiraceae bacterium]|nr:S8 family serine peptidase [Saprospiraceae bacterium]